MSDLDTFDDAEALVRVLCSGGCRARRSVPTRVPPRLSSRARRSTRCSLRSSAELSLVLDRTRRVVSPCRFATSLSFLLSFDESLSASRRSLSRSLFTATLGYVVLLSAGGALRRGGGAASPGGSSASALAAPCAALAEAAATTRRLRFVSFSYASCTLRNFSAEPPGLSG